MAIYKRYNTRKKKIPWSVIIWVSGILLVFALTVWFGHYLGQKAGKSEELYLGGTGPLGGEASISPLVEKTLRGEYVEPSELADFVSASEDVWASTWIYKDGKATFATEFDKRYGIAKDGLPSLDSFDIKANTIGMFEVQGIYAEHGESVITEYELLLLEEFSQSGLDEVLLVFNDVTKENSEKVFEFAKKVKVQSVVCVPYSMLGDSAFFAEAADNRLLLALNAEDVSPEQLASDIEKHSFYFTKYNLRLVIGGEDAALVDVLYEKVLPNYQFSSKLKEQKK